MSIGERIAELRTEQNISQVQLAKLLDISRQAISKWENDQTAPDTINLIKLAEVLDTDVEYLATGRRGQQQPAPVVVQLTERVDKVVEKVVEKPVVHKVIRTRYLRNPMEFALCGLAGLIVGLLLGLLI